MRKIIFEKVGKASTETASVNQRKDVKITQLWHYDGAKEEVLLLTYREATSIAVAILAAFPDDTAALIKGMYKNYLNQNNEK